MANPKPVIARVVQGSSNLEGLVQRHGDRLGANDAANWAVKAELILDYCHPKQRDFVLDPGRRVTALVPRGSGKTTADRARIFRRMLLTPKARCLFIAVTRGQASELMWVALKDLAERLGVKARFNETILKCTLVGNGSTVRLVGADDKKEIEKLRGQPFHEVIIDEAASFYAALLENLIYRVIGPRLGDYNGVLVMTGTPGHELRGPFYEATRVGSEIHRRWEDRDNPDDDGKWEWSHHTWTLLDGAPYVPAMQRLWDEALLQKEKRHWTDSNPIWRREYLAIWSNDTAEAVYSYRPHDDEGAELNQWDPLRDKDGFAELPKTFTDWSYAYGMDMGHHDPFAIVIFAFSPSDPTQTIYQVYEFDKKGMFPTAIAQLLIGEDLDRDKPKGLIGKTGEPEGMVMDQAGSGDAILLELSNQYGITIKPADKKNKLDSIEMFNGRLNDGQVKILKGSHLAGQLIELQWKMDEFGKVKEDKAQRNDLCFVAGTLVKTAMGDVAIEDVRAGDMVWTRSGLRRVVASGMTGYGKTFRLNTADGRILEGTASHKVLTESGWKSLEALTPHDTLAAEPVPSAAGSSLATGLGVPAVVPCRVLAVEATGFAAPVYDLTVADEHEFFANGIVVHNCDAAIYAARVVYRLEDEVREVTPRKRTEFQRAGEPDDEKPRGEFDDLLGDDGYDDSLWGN